MIERERARRILQCCQSPPGYFIAPHDSNANSQYDTINRFITTGRPLCSLLIRMQVDGVCALVSVCAWVYYESPNQNPES